MSTGERSKLKLGYEHYVMFPDDGRRHEIIDGDHYVNPAPSTYHQTLSKRLQYHLYSRIELNGTGLIFNAPIDVQLGENDIVQPDLVVVLNTGRALVTPSRIQGPPDLLIEILSPTTAKNDSGLKRTVYERSGVTEYWIVDPFEPGITQFMLKGGTYVTMPRSDDLQLCILPEVVIPLKEIW